jgi:hypothetical protein
MKHMMAKPLILIAAFVALAQPVPAQAFGSRADTLTDLLIEASGGGELDRNRYDYDILIQTVIALEALGGDPDLGGATLLDVLSNPEAEVTVFTPNDKAMRRLARVAGWDRRGGDAGALDAIVAAFDFETIRDVVKYHVVPERLGVFQVLRKRVFDTALPGASFRRYGVRLVDNDPDLRDPTLTFPLQLRGGKSIAHTITRVLIPVDL